MQPDPDDNELDPDLNDPGDDPKPKQPDIRDLRRRADQAAALEREVEQLKAEKAERERAEKIAASVSKVGVPAEQTDKFQRLVASMLPADADEEAVRMLAEEYGFLQADTSAQDEARRLAQGGSMHRSASAPVVGSQAAVSELKDLSKRILANDPTVTKAQILEAAQKAGVVIDDSIEVGSVVSI